jgi:hypothetical protein
VNIPPNNNDLYQVTTDSGGNWASAGESLSGCAEQVQSWLGTWNIRGPAQTLANLLNGTAKFFLPGAGTLLYKNPVFNNENDLLVEAHYNGLVNVQYPTFLADLFPTCKITDTLSDTALLTGWVVNRCLVTELLGPRRLSCVS